MKSELAKQLKEAGFPQIWLHHSYYTAEGLIFRPDSTRGLKGDEICIPTLSELIEAIPGFFMLKRRGGPTSEFKAYDYDYETGIGDTPEEAVAKLWLALKGDD